MFRLFFECLLYLSHPIKIIASNNITFIDIITLQSIKYSKKLIPAIITFTPVPDWHSHSPQIPPNPPQYSSDSPQSTHYSHSPAAHKSPSYCHHQTDNKNVSDTEIYFYDDSPPSNPNISTYSVQPSYAN